MSTIVLSVNDRCENLLREIDKRMTNDEEIVITQVCKELQVSASFFPMIKQRGLIHQYQKEKKYYWTPKFVLDPNDLELSFKHWAAILVTDLRAYNNSSKSRQRNTSDLPKSTATQKLIPIQKTEPIVASGYAKALQQIESNIPNTVDCPSFSSTPKKETVSVVEKVAERLGKSTEVYYTLGVLTHLGQFRFDRQFTFQFESIKFTQVDSLTFSKVDDVSLKINVIDKAGEIIAEVLVPNQKLYIIDKKFTDGTISMNAEPKNQKIHFKLS